MTDAPISRRVLLASVAGTLGALALDRAGMAQVPGQAPTVPPDPTKVPGAPLSDLGQRSPFERPRRIAVGSGQGSSLAPLQDLVGIVTPADLHFERHHAGVRSEEHTSELQSRLHLVCRLLLEKKKKKKQNKAKKQTKKDETDRVKKNGKMEGRMQKKDSMQCTRNYRDSIRQQHTTRVELDHAN